jgi:hypothetical protein
MYIDHCHKLQKESNMKKYLFTYWSAVFDGGDLKFGYIPGTVLITTESDDEAKILSVRIWKNIQNRAVKEKIVDGYSKYYAAVEKSPVLYDISGEEDVIISQEKDFVF